MFPPHVILHPTDLAESSRHAFQTAVDLARHHHARLVLLLVAHPPRLGELSYAEAATELQPEGLFRRLGLEMRQALPAPPDVPLEYLVRQGSPAPEVAAVARELGADLIVIATHGRTGLNRLLLGSTAEQILRQAPCAVLITKAPPADKVRG